MEWVALSYVWRLAVDSVPASSLVGRLPTGLRLPDMIPGLIVDAMKVVRGLGYRYLWVDRYCINQDDVAEKQEQIAQMDRIYRGAELTIIAAGDYNGLGGVGEDPATQRKPLGAVSFGPSMTLYETDPSPIAEVKRSAWFTRGWTFQEAILSRRRLFF
ncbi:heterokaryon incompatibility, partial [Schizothecium vesticola]